MQQVQLTEETASRSLRPSEVTSACWIWAVRPGIERIKNVIEECVLVEGMSLAEGERDNEQKLAGESKKESIVREVNSKVLNVTSEGEIKKNLEIIKAEQEVRIEGNDMPKDRPKIEEVNVTNLSELSKNIEEGKCQTRKTEKDIMDIKMHENREETSDAISQGLMNTSEEYYENEMNECHPMGNDTIKAGKDKTKENAEVINYLQEITNENISVGKSVENIKIYDSKSFKEENLKESSSLINVKEGCVEKTMNAKSERAVIMTEEKINPLDLTVIQDERNSMKDEEIKWKGESFDEKNNQKEVCKANIVIAENIFESMKGSENIQKLKIGDYNKINLIKVDSMNLREKMDTQNSDISEERNMKTGLTMNKVVNTSVDDLGDARFPNNKSNIKREINCLIEKSAVVAFEENSSLTENTSGDARDAVKEVFLEVDEMVEEHPKEKVIIKVGEEENSMQTERKKKGEKTNENEDIIDLSEIESKNLHTLSNERFDKGLYNEEEKIVEHPKEEIIKGYGKNINTESKKIRESTNEDEVAVIEGFSEERWENMKIHNSEKLEEKFIIENRVENFSIENLEASVEENLDVEILNAKDKSSSEANLQELRNANKNDPKPVQKCLMEESIKKEGSGEDSNIIEIVNMREDEIIEELRFQDKIETDNVNLTKPDAKNIHISNEHDGEIKSISDDLSIFKCKIEELPLNNCIEIEEISLKDCLNFEEMKIHDRNEACRFVDITKEKNIETLNSSDGNAKEINRSIGDELNIYENICKELFLGKSSVIEEISVGCLSTEESKNKDRKETNDFIDFELDKAVDICENLNISDENMKEAKRSISEEINVIKNVVKEEFLAEKDAEGFQNLSSDLNVEELKIQVRNEINEFVDFVTEEKEVNIGEIMHSNDIVEGKRNICQDINVLEDMSKGEGELLAYKCSVNQDLSSRKALCIDELTIEDKNETNDLDLFQEDKEINIDESLNINNENMEEGKSINEEGNLLDELRGREVSVDKNNIIMEKDLCTELKIKDKNEGNYLDYMKELDDETIGENADSGESIKEAKINIGEEVNIFEVMPKGELVLDKSNVKEDLILRDLLIEESKIQDRSEANDLVDFIKENNVNIDENINDESIKEVERSMTEMSIFEVMHKGREEQVVDKNNVKDLSLKKNLFIEEMKIEHKIEINDFVDVNPIKDDNEIFEDYLSEGGRRELPVDKSNVNDINSWGGLKKIQGGNETNHLDFIKEENDVNIGENLNVFGKTIEKVKKSMTEEINILDLSKEQGLSVDKSSVLEDVNLREGLFLEKLKIQDGNETNDFIDFIKKEDINFGKNPDINDKNKEVKRSITEDANPLENGFGEESSLIHGKKKANDFGTFNKQSEFYIDLNFNISDEHKREVKENVSEVNIFEELSLGEGKENSRTTISLENSGTTEKVKSIAEDTYHDKENGDKETNMKEMKVEKKSVCIENIVKVDDKVDVESTEIPFDEHIKLSGAAKEVKNSINEEGGLGNGKLKTEKESFPVNSIRMSEEWKESNAKKNCEAALEDETCIAEIDKSNISDVCGNSISNEDDSTYNTNVGKWMLFLNKQLRDENGDSELDRVWREVTRLVGQGDLFVAKCSTAVDECGSVNKDENGVIICYTADYTNTDDVKKTADVIRSSIFLPKPIFYKTDRATYEGKYRITGSKHISLYKHDIQGKLFVRDGSRWKAVPTKKVMEGNFMPYKPSEILTKAKILAQENEDSPYDCNAGKWMLFLNKVKKDDEGYTELDRAWIRIKALVEEGILCNAVCTTGMKKSNSPGASDNEGPIFCYTLHYGDIADAKRAAEAIRGVVSLSKDMVYKRNESQRYRFKQNYRQKNPSIYKHTKDSVFYEKIRGKWVVRSPTSNSGNAISG